MYPREPWIWLPEREYPNRQTTVHTAMLDPAVPRNYTVVRLTKTYKIGKPINKIILRSSGDTMYRLTLNQVQIAVGPATPGGDFLYNELPRSNYYAYSTTIDDTAILKNSTLSFVATVRMAPSRICEFSKGHGGFFMTAHLFFDDGTESYIGTDESWLIQCLPAYKSAAMYDGTLPAEKPVNAKYVKNIWFCEDAPIPPCSEVICTPQGGGVLTVPAGCTVDKELIFDKIYASYLSIYAETNGILNVHTECFETNENGSTEDFVFCEPTSYTGFTMHSAGGIRIHSENKGETDATLCIRLLTSCFPVDENTAAHTVTSDNGLNLVTDVCTHTLRYCRQTHHLDSPRHCEPLACTGDYYIETLMTAFTFGDMRLASFDVIRTAELLRNHDGRMFHTSYSLIWVLMLYDVYRFTGDKALLLDCREALSMLLARFRTYIGENGIIENPPNYMFVDWLNPDGISTHHPPKALGQTCLNLYYYGALKTASEIYAILGCDALKNEQLHNAELLKHSILSLLYDSNRGLFFEGLNTPTPENLLYNYMPQNVEKRYYRKHANILAAYFGIVDKASCREILTKVMEDETLGDVQPYFMHFLLDAVYRNGLREVYTLRILEQWKKPCEECHKGLIEGFLKPEPTYHFDHSHAWGGTPAYALPLALSGFEMLEPRFKKIRLNPSLLGLSFAQVEIPTPFGKIAIVMEKGKETQVTIPDGICLL